MSAYFLLFMLPSLRLGLSCSVRYLNQVGFILYNFNVIFNFSIVGLVLVWHVRILDGSLCVFYLLEHFL